MQISEWSETVLAKQFRYDPRAGLPEVGGGARPIPHVAAGVPIHLRDRLYTGLRKSSFPYGRWDQSDGQLVERELRFVAIENERFRVVVCPDLGGRILSIWDRLHHADMLWHQPVLHQEVFGLAGAWFVGGIEFNANRFGHLVHGQSTLRTSVVGNRDNPIGLSIAAVDEAFGCSWEAIIRPCADHVAMDFRFENHSSRPAPAYWWTNIAVPAHRHIRVMMQPGPVLHHGVFRPGFDTANWPMLDGSDWSKWQNQHEIDSIYFHEPSDGIMGYVDEERQLAFVHHADPAVCRGRKLWTIGNGHDRTAWWNRLGEPGLASYYEMQSGLAPTQLQADSLAPGRLLEWTETFKFKPLQISGGEDYETVWRRFVGVFEVASQQPDDPVDAAANLRQTIVEPDARQTLSERIVLNAESISDHDVHVASEQGWLAGDAWIARLQSLKQQTVWTQLALTAALLDTGKFPDAIAASESLVSQRNEAAGWCSLLLGREMVAEGRVEEALSLIRHAVVHLSDRVEAWSELVRLLLHTGADGEAEQCISHMPSGVSREDGGRILHAKAALARGDWLCVQWQTEAPFHSTAEADVEAWVLRKESFVGQAFELAGRGNFNEALRLLIEAGRAMPQFGTGTDLTNSNGDLMYYRWVIANHAGQRWSAGSIARLLLEIPSHPASTDALYAARLAKQTGDPSYARRRKQIEDWNRQDAKMTSVLPLRLPIVQAIDGDMSGFATLGSHPIYRHRAAIESFMSSGALANKS